MSKLDFPCSESWALDINESGHILGTYQDLKQKCHIFVWDAQNDSMLFDVDYGDRDVFPIAINDMGQCLYEIHYEGLSIKGFRLTNGDYEHVLWDPHKGCITMDSQIPSNYGLSIIEDLNNNGYMLGRIYNRQNDQSKHVIFKPITDNPSLLSE